MPRGRAEPTLAGLLRRVEEVNATPHHLFRIPTVIVYGSYVRGEAFLSDVDIAVDLEPKWERASKEFEVQSKKRVDVAQAKGRRFSNIVEYSVLAGRGHAPSEGQDTSLKPSLNGRFCPHEKGQQLRVQSTDRQRRQDSGAAGEAGWPLTQPR
jgi:predicted nucleotidyltransferase